MIGGFASRIRASRREGCITILSSVMPEEGGKEVRTEERERGVCNTPNLHEPTILRWQDRAKGDFIKLFAPKSSGRTIIHRLLKNSFAAIPLLIGCLRLPPLPYTHFLPFFSEKYRFNYWRSFQCFLYPSFLWLCIWSHRCWAMSVSALYSFA